MKAEALESQSLTKSEAIQSKFLTKPETLARVRLSDSTVARLEARGLFPKRVKLGVRKVGWRVTEIAAWEADRPTSSSDLTA